MPNPLFHAVGSLKGLRIHPHKVSAPKLHRIRLPGMHGAEKHAKPDRLREETGWKGEGCERRRREEEGREGEERSRHLNMPFLVSVYPVNNMIIDGHAATETHRKRFGNRDTDEC